MPRPTASLLIRLPPAAPGQRIGLLGGSFNPAHAGHRQISAIARRRLRLDQVWWLVSPGNPLKAHHDLAPLDQRLAQARRVAAARWITVTGFEAQLGSPYTVDTLAFLAARHPQTHFVWLMGADNLAQMHRWRDWRRIVTLLPIAVIDRPGWHLGALASPAARALARHRIDQRYAASIAHHAAPAWTYLTGPLSSLSSSMIRAGGRSQSQR
jgi:nicotinate-nucleotide adenylyltransferase